jgi:DNA-binding NarL/FixJ family response regulator
MAYVLIVDDHPFVAAATAREVASLMPDAVAHRAESIQAAERVVAEHGRDPDVILLDLYLPDTEGLSGLVRLRQLVPGAVIAIVSGEVAPQVMRDAFAQGARGYLTKTRDVDAFTDGLRKLLEHGFFFPPEAAQSPVRDRRAANLTEREVAVLQALASGKVNKQLADTLGVAETTYKSHLRAIYRKLGVRTRVEAVGRARELGLIDSRRQA